VIEVIEAEGLLERVVQAGDYLGQRLAALVTKYPGHAVEARGRGLLRGLAVAGSPVAVVTACRDQGLLLSVAGDKVVRFAPPYVIDRALIDQAVAILDGALAAGAGKG
jgi:acetylornithine/succinyldiaminopimelate/putrescine aminotransferase